MCKFYLDSNERMEPADSKHLELINGDHVGSSTTQSVDPDQSKSTEQDVSGPPMAPLTSSTMSLTSSDSVASNFSEYSVVASLYDGPSAEDGGIKNGQDDSRSNLPNGHVTDSRSINVNNSLQQLDDLEESHKKGNIEFAHGDVEFNSHDTHHDDSEGSEDNSDEAEDESPTYDDQDEIWLPPEAVNEDDNSVFSVTAWDDDDDECANGDGSEWAMPSSLSSYEEEKQKEMEQVVNGKFKNLVSQVLRKVGVDDCDNKKPSWVDIVTQLAWQAAAFVKPETADGKAMDPAGYVKIKCIASGSREESRLIKGLVFKKHAAHKHMVTRYENPRLLLVRGGLEPSSDPSGLSSFSSMMSEDKDNFADLLENLKTCKPNVILVEKSASRDVLQKVLDLKVTLVLDMKLHRLERIARCTCSHILSSDKPFSQKLKHCGSLHFEKVVEEHAIVGEGEKKPCKTLMFLDGCPTRHGCTILLKGSHSEKLKKIKCVVQCAVVMAYHFLLETFFLVDQKVMFSTIGNRIAILSTDKQSTFAHSESSDVDCDLAVKHVSISNGGDEGPSPMQDSTSESSSSHVLDNQIPDESHNQDSSECRNKKSDAETADVAISNSFLGNVPYDVQNSTDDSSTDVQESHITALSISSPSVNDALETVSLVSPATFEDMTAYMNLNEREPNAEIAVSIPVSPAEKGPEENDLKANSSTDDISHHEDASALSSESAADEEMKGAVDGEDSIRTKDEISNVLDSESILVLMSSRNALKGTICEQSHFSQIKFYRSFDIPLGKFLLDNLFNKNVPCKACNELPEAHFYYYAHHNKQLTIRVKRLHETDALPGETNGKLWMWSRCGKCAPDKEKATKRVLVSTAARGLSFGKFLELSLSSESSFNRLSSCGHSFQKDFLYFFGLGSMVAMFRYSSVSTYTTSLPPQKLEFNGSINTDWLQHEIQTVYTKGLLLLSEIANYLKKIEPRYYGQNLILNGLPKAFPDIVDMLKLERSGFEDGIKNIGVNCEHSHNTVHKLLSLNRLRWEILLEACVWDRRLHWLLSYSSTLPLSPVTADMAKRQLDSKEHCKTGEATNQSQTSIAKESAVETVLEDEKSSSEVEKTQEVDDGPEQELLNAERDSSEGTKASVSIIKGQIGLKECSAEEDGVQRASQSGLLDTVVDAKGITSRGNQNCSSIGTDVEVHVEDVTRAEELSVPEVPKEGALQGCGEQDSVSLFINDENQEPIGITNVSSHLDSNVECIKTDNILSGNLSEDRSIPIEGDEEEKSNSVDKEVSGRVVSPPLPSPNSREWVWNSFAEIRDDCTKALYNGCFPKFGHIPKFLLLSSSDFLPTVSELIIEEGSRLHIPLLDGEYIVSDFDGEISSSVACALAFVKDLTSPAADGVENATLKRAISEPGWHRSTSFDPDVIHSAVSMSFSEARFPGFSDGLSHLDSLVSYGQVHLEVTLGVQKYPVKGKYSVVIFYANEFRAFREQCCPSELDYIASLSRCKLWDAKGGKSKSLFAKTLDDRLIIKEIKKTELESFMKFATEYFDYMKQSVKLGNQTCLAKILGIYQVTIRHPKTGKESRHDLMVMENLSFGRNIIRQYDLKGALHARFTATADGTGDVLLDQNFVNDMNASPLYIGQRAKRLLQRAVWNDTTFLHTINVMDYSLLVGVDGDRPELLCGIIDYLRQYTWDKQFETWVKSSLVPKNVSPTIISPEMYKKRFRKFMDTHFLTVPDHWCSQRSSYPCKLCGIKSNDSSLQKLEKPEEELNGSNAHN